MESRQQHWDEVHATKPADSVSWYQAAPEPSLGALKEADVTPSASLIDIGAGASLLVDTLLDRGWSDLSVLDIAASALDIVKGRLGNKISRVQWIVADITAWRPDQTYDVWHDRAVFHFLTRPEQRRSYRRALEAGTENGSLVVLATFAPDGPERCSGLPICRYDEAGIVDELGPAFALVRHWQELHETPGGAKQSFQWCVLRRT